MSNASHRATPLVRKLVLPALVALACSGGDGAEDLGFVGEALSSVDRVLGFEGVSSTPSQSDWTLGPGSSGAISPSTTHSEGSTSVQLSNVGWAQIQSVRIGPLGQVAATAKVDVRVPGSGTIPWGDVILQVDAPSQGLQNAQVSQVLLGGKAKGSWQTLTFPVSSSFVTKLSSAAMSDLSVRFSVNVPAGSTVHLDKATFGQPPGASGGAGGTGGSAGTGGTAGTAGGSGIGGSGAGGSTGAAGGSGGSATTGGAGGSGGSGAASGSGGTGGPPGNPVEFFFRLPAGVPREAVALDAHGGSLTLEDYSKVITPNGGFSSVSGVDSTTTTTIGANAELQSIWSQASVLMKASSRAHGNVTTQGTVSRLSGAVVDGVTTENKNLAPLQRPSWSVTFPAGALAAQTVSTAKSFAPGAYGATSIKQYGKLTLAAGTYTFKSLSLETGGTLDLDNRNGPIFIYVETTLSWVGTSTLRDTAKDNVLFGVAGSNALTLVSSFRGVLVAPYTTVTLGSCTPSHSGAFFAKSLKLAQHGIVRHRPFTPDNFCAGSECTGLCPCDPDDEGGECESDGDCALGARCVDGTCGGAGSPCSDSRQCTEDDTCHDGFCRPLGCLLNPVTIGCGFDGAPCGPCTKHGTCTSDADCASGYVCPPDNGFRYALPELRVCERPECATIPETLGCGGPLDECGVCVCTPHCETKQCGDADLSNGCGGRCVGVCGGGEAGCALDSDCEAGFICRDAICRPAAPCADATVAPPQCGAVSSLCGTCPTVERFAGCGERECGLVPGTVQNCGSCGGGHFCNAAGHCARLDVTPPVEVPDPDGTPRAVMPSLAPPAVGIGTIPGAFSVSERGNATYSIPLELPPGRGIEPMLSLRYSSGTSNGALGVGWSIDGLSTITRCARTFAQDGFAQPVLGTEADALCLDGHRLVPVAGEHWRFGTEYRTVPDTFDRIRVVDDDDERVMFRVFKRDGRIFTYGGTSSAQSFLHGATIGMWALNKVEDRSGNFMAVTYRRLIRTLDDGFTSTSEMAPDVITYTGHGATAGDREVQFHYEGRPDWITGYRPGRGALTRTLKLYRIDVRAQGQLVRMYSLAHTADRVSRLESLVECVGPTASICKPATTFEYLDPELFEPGRLTQIPELLQGDGSYRPPPAGIGAVGITFRRGTRDWLSTGTTSTFISTHARGYIAPIAFGVSFVPVWGSIASKAANILATEFDARNRTYVFQPFDFLLSTDGMVPRDQSYGIQTQPAPCPRMRIPRRHIITEPWGIGGPQDSMKDHCPLSAPTGRVIANRESCGETGLLGALVDDGLCPQEIFFNPGLWMVDVNADGVQDKLYCNVGDSTRVHYALARPQTGSTTVPWDVHGEGDGSFPAFGDVCDYGCHNNTHKICTDDLSYSTSLDVDGDGTLNLVVYDHRLGWAALDFAGNESSWNTTRFAGVTIQPMSSYTAYYLDANGDGLKDILGISERASAGPSLIAYNTGSGFSQQALVADLHALPRVPGVVLDHDHDGKEEVVFPPLHSATWPAVEVVGGNLVVLDTTGIVAGAGTFGDFDGDGTTDLFAREASGFMIYKGSGRHRNLLKTVVDGLGHRIDIDYDKPRDSVFNVFNGQYDTNQCGWPVNCQERASQAMVSSHQESHYVDQGRTIQEEDREYAYFYQGALHDSTGGGFLGFARRGTIVRDGSGVFLGQTTVESKSLPRKTTPPYLYLTAGLPETIRESLPGATSEFSSGGCSNQLNKTSSFVWEEKVSTVAQPFAALTSTTTRVASTSCNRSLPLHETTADFLVDGYGNVTDSTVYTRVLDFAGTVSGGETITQTHTTFAPSAEEVDAWLVSLPKAVDVTSAAGCTTGTDCVRGTHRRSTALDYEPLTTLVRRVTRAPDLEGAGSDLFRTSDLGHDAFGNVTSSIVRDEEGQSREAIIVFDARGMFPIAIQQIGEGQIRETKLRFDDRFGLLTVRADPNGIEETWSHDELGVERHHLGPEGERQTSYQGADFYLSGLGQEIRAAFSLTSQQVGGAHIVEEYNSFGQPVRRTTRGLRGREVFQEFLYDARHRLTFEWRPHVEGDSSQRFIEHQYDELDRPVRTVLADGAVLQRQYAPDESALVPVRIAGAVEYVKTVDPRGKVSIVALNHRGQTAGVTNAVGATTTYEYGPFDQFTAILDGDEDVVRVGHDDYGRATSVLDLARGATPETTAYDALDQVIRTEDAANRVQRSFYDDFGRIERMEDPDGPTIWIYDGTEQNEIGRLTETVSPTGQRTFYRYQPREVGRNRGLLSRITQRVAAPAGAGSTGEPVDMTTDYHYDGSSRLTQVDYPGPSGARFGVAYGFDDFGHTIEARSPADASKVYWQLIDDFQGYRTQTERLGSATCDGETGTRTVRTYDNETGTLGGIVSTCGTRVLQELAYDYDPSRGMKARVDHLTGISETFANDDLDRISQQDGATSYTYEGLSSRLQGAFTVGTYGYDAAQGRDWVRTAGSSSFEHDAVGNISHRGNASVTGGAQTITYTTFDLPATITNAAGTTTFGYDSSGTRVLKQSATKTTYYAGDLYQRSVSAAGVAQNMWMVYAGGRAVAQATSDDSEPNLSAPTLRYLYEDALGSIQTIAGADATLLGARNYSPFGVQRNAGGLDAEVPFGFTGHHTDPELGLINMRGRIYDPHLGQFLTADPLMTEPEGAGLNRFAYVKNGPLDATDPTGLYQVPRCFTCPEFTAFPGSVNQPGPSTAGSTGIGPSAANPVSPASSGAAPAGAGVSGGDGAGLAPGDAASWGDIAGYGVSNGPGIADAALNWAETAKHQEHTWKPVAMTRTEPGSDAAVRPYGNSANGLATGGSAEGAATFQDGWRGPPLGIAQDAGGPSSGAEGQGSTGSDVPTQIVFAPTPDYRLFVDKDGVFAVEFLEAGGGRGAVRLLRGTTLTKFLRNKLGHIKNAIAAGGYKGIAGAVSVRDSIKLGERFVGSGFTITKGGRVFLSADGLRQFRLPAFKRAIDPLTGQRFSKTGIQVNFESRASAFGRWLNNVHLDVLR